MRLNSSILSVLVGCSLLVVSAGCGEDVVVGGPGQGTGGGSSTSTNPGTAGGVATGTSSSGGTVIGNRHLFRRRHHHRTGNGHWNGNRHLLVRLRHRALARRVLRRWTIARGHLRSQRRRSVRVDVPPWALTPSRRPAVRTPVARSQRSPSCARMAPPASPCARSTRRAPVAGNSLAPSRHSTLDFPRC